MVYIQLDKANGAVLQLLTSEMGDGMAVGQGGITMLDDGSIFGSRLSETDDKTYFFHIKTPNRTGDPVAVTQLGVMPEDIMLEALYTDCDGKLYGMDTGSHEFTAEGNRLLRFTGDYLTGDFSFVVVSDLGTADVADIDDMGPGIVDGAITDNPGLAIDTGTVYDFNYESGNGGKAGSGGTYGIHALGPDLFTDNVARLYVLSNSGELFEMDPSDYSLSSALVAGPTKIQGDPGWSGLAGPLTDCDSGFID